MREKNVFVVILAGGSGERFWPLSRKARPKQFLALVGNRTMLQHTVDRLAGLVDSQRTFIITGRAYLELTKSQVPQVPEENIIAEPVSRNTAAAVGLAAELLTRQCPGDVMVVLPADHYIADVARFQAVLRAAIAAARDGQWAVTIGITPTRPETGYGYIRRGELHNVFMGVPAYRALRFTEKPNLKQAREFLATGEYLWNSGMFIWRIDLIRQLIAQFLPELHEGLRQLAGVHDGQLPAAMEAVYPQLPDISVDYGIMERAANVLVLPGDFGWDDVGSWPALEGYRENDGRGNVLEGRGVLMDTRNTLVYAPHKVVATLGVENLIIADAGDSLLVCHKERAQEIKRLLAELRAAGFSEVL
ncbi:mannose-1-phosphate guanylyltransferase [Desulfovirgula thermocuniculi]|uniref:mannose-1-phosphate guanylyltransferase n=1 Tax=Desulfovirgula thermocuniculi TaxID=348842 RepID=UPI0004154507|nr:mannose-1-phosphate guanylyltransferase [Desulfovirgula thermocuniculi]